jgi:hypothetical protein
MISKKHKQGPILSMLGFLKKLFNNSRGLLDEWSFQSPHPEKLQKCIIKIQNMI